MDNIINGIRTIFKAGATAHISVDLNKLIREVLSIAQTEHWNSQIEVHTNLDSKLPLVSADRVQLQQVIFNLITNAIDAIETVIDRERRLRVMSELNGENSIFVTIEDTGTGFASGDIDRIFDTFFTTKSHGMGMGLSIYRTIIEAHGGRLSASPGNPTELSSGLFCQLSTTTCSGLPDRSFDHLAVFSAKIGAAAPQRSTNFVNLIGVLVERAAHHQEDTSGAHTLGLCAPAS